MALWAIEKSNRRVTVERRGSRPDSTISVGMDVIVLNVEAWERNTKVVVHHEHVDGTGLERCARRRGEARRDACCDARRIGQSMQGNGGMARRIGGPEADAQRADIRGRNVGVDEDFESR